METDTALVGANGVVVLHAVAHVGLVVALIVHPGHAELINTVGDAKTLNQIYLFKLGVLVVLLFDSTQYLFHCLVILRLVGEASLQIF